jgi:hypothetical protein
LEFFHYLKKIGTSFLLLPNRTGSPIRVRRSLEESVRCLGTRITLALAPRARHVMEKTGKKKAPAPQEVAAVSTRVCYYYDPRVSYVDYGEGHDMLCPTA